MPKLEMIFTSHGLKRKRPLPKADLYLDCRMCKDNVSPKEIAKTNRLELTFFEELIENSLLSLVTRRYPKHPYHRPFTVCCLCAWGSNRSPAVARLLYEYYRKRDVCTLLEPK